MRQSTKIIKQCLARLPAGPVRIQDNKFTPPKRQEMKKLDGGADPSLQAVHRGLSRAAGCDVYGDREPERASSGCILWPMVAIGRIGARSGRPGSRSCRRSSTCRVGICWPTQSRSSGRSTWCSARSTGRSWPTTTTSWPGRRRLGPIGDRGQSLPSDPQGLNRRASRSTAESERDDRVGAEEISAGAQGQCGDCRCCISCSARWAV